VLTTPSGHAQEGHTWNDKSPCVIDGAVPDCRGDDLGDEDFPHGRNLKRADRPAFAMDRGLFNGRGIYHGRGSARETTQCVLVTDSARVHVNRVEGLDHGSDGNVQDELVMLLQQASGEVLGPRGHSDLRRIAINDESPEDG